MNDNTPVSLEDRVDEAVTKCDELTRILHMEVDLLHNRDYDALRETNKQKESIEETLTQLVEAGLRVPQDSSLADRLRQAHQKLSEALERNQRVNEAHQNAVAHLRDIVRNTAEDAQDDGIYDPKPSARKPRGGQSLSRDV